jgi:hypothetical protein
MTDVGKVLIVVGVVVALLGVAVWGLGRVGFRGLPGDIAYQGDHVRVYFPIVTCVVLSILLTGILWLWQWLSRR